MKYSIFPKVLNLILIMQICIMYAMTDTLVIKLKPSGIFNDPLMMQNALNTTSATPVKIILDPGDYFFNRPVYTKNDKFSIVGTPNTIIHITGVNDFLIIQNSQIKVGNFKVVGNGISAKDFYHGRAILLHGTDHVKISNISFSKISGANIILYPNGNKDCTNSIISGNIIEQPAFSMSKDGDESAIMLGYSGNGYYHNDNLIVGNYIDGNYIDGNYNLNVGIGMIAHGKNNTIKNNTVKNCLSYGIIGYESQYKNYSLQGTQIIGNKVSNIGSVYPAKTPKGMGIYLMKSHNSLIKDNIVTDVMRNSDKSETLTAGAIASSGGKNIIIERNTINGSRMYGIVIAYGFNSKILGNTIDGVEKSGIYLINLNDILIENNMFRNIKDVVFKGYFGNTSNKIFLNNGLLKKYQYISTGQNINIQQNEIFNPRSLLLFSGQQSKQNYVGNTIQNNRFSQNIIYTNDKDKKNTVIFNICSPKDTNQLAING